MTCYNHPKKFQQGLLFEQYSIESALISSQREMPNDDPYSLPRAAS
jgi:hypothetical protein